MTQGLSEVYDSGRVLNEKELQITGVPKGMQYFKLASKGRRNIRRLNKKLASQTEAADIVTMPYIIAKWDRELMDRERDRLKVHPSITYNSSQSKSSTDLFILLKETTKTRSRNPLPISPKKNNTLLKALQTVSPFKKAQIPEEKEEKEDNIKDEDLQQFKSDNSDNKDGLNRREKEYFTSK